MLDGIAMCPRSIYPQFDKKKYDFSRDSNLDKYYKTADRLKINVSKIGPDQISPDLINIILEKIITSKDIYEMTVYAEALWDAYNSYHIAYKYIKARINRSGKLQIRKLILLLQYLQMHKRLNRRPILGKNYKEIYDDSEYFKKISGDAIVLLAKFDK